MSSEGVDTNSGAGSIVSGTAVLFAGVAAIFKHGVVHDGVARAITEPGIEAVVQWFVWGLEVGAALAILFVVAAVILLIASN